MITKELFSDLPPFPDDVTSAPIARISLKDIVSQDPKTADAVLEACRTDGFFYLDVTTTDSGNELLSQAEDLLRVSQKAFDHPIEEKAQHALLKGVNLFGYKHAGTVKSTDKTQRPDSTEFFNVAKDHMHGVAESRSYPSEVHDNKALFQGFTKNAHALGMDILEVLAKKLDLPSDEFAKRNIFTKTAGDHCRLTYKPGGELDDSAVGLPSHTDFGSITILFNWLGGLQIQSRQPGHIGEWVYVKPVPGCAVINLGDAMVTFSNGLLKSAKHRVVPAPGEQVKADRYSVVYFVRPHDEVIMEPIEKFKDLNENLKVTGKFEPEGGAILTAGDWMRQRGRQMGS